MKNLIKAVTEKAEKEQQEFIKEMRAIKTKDINALNNWRYNALLPKGKRITFFPSVKEAKEYLTKRKLSKLANELQSDIENIKRVFAAADLISIKIQVEWKKSRTWGSNPTAEAWLTFKNKEGNSDSSYKKYGPVSGCGYDKLSTAVAGVLNQFDEVLKPMYKIKDKQAGSNHEIFGYGAGYGIFPAFEGGVGVSCYPKIFNKMGFEFNTIASGKDFDVFEVKKIKK